MRSSASFSSGRVRSMRSPLLRAASAACANRGLMPSATCRAVVPRGTCLALPSGSLMVMVSGINYSVYREEESVVSSQRRDRRQQKAQAVADSQRLGNFLKNQDACCVTYMFRCRAAGPSCCGSFGAGSDRCLLERNRLPVACFLHPNAGEAHVAVDLASADLALDLAGAGHNGAVAVNPYCHVRWFVAGQLTGA